MYPISQHRIVADGSLNRRSIEEQFMFWASQFNNVKDYNIALRTLKREKFTLDAHQEIWNNRSVDFNAQPHKFYEEPKLNTQNVIINTAPGGVFWVDWSLNYTDNNAYTLRVAPFADGKILWRGADKIENEYPLVVSGGNYYRLRTVPDGIHTLSGQCYFSSETGSFEVGLVAAATSELSGSGWGGADGIASGVQLTVRRVL